MADPTKLLTHLADGLGNLLSQFKGQPNFAGFLGSYLVQVQELEDVFFSLMVERYVDTAIGAQLDGLGRVVGELRLGKNDTDYRIAIKGRIVSNRAHSRIENIYALFVLLLPGSTFELIEGATASFLFIIDQALTPSDPSAEVLNATLQVGKGAGIGASLIWGDVPRDERFTYAPGDVLVADTVQGYADNPVQTFGGAYADVVS